jgi:hypothetical protein
MSAGKKQLIGKATMYFYAGVIVFVIGVFGMPSILPFSWLLLVVTGYYYGQAKGYSSLVSTGLGFFGALGLGVLLFMPDKNLLAPAEVESVES